KLNSKMSGNTKPALTKLPIRIFRPTREPSSPASDRGILRSRQRRAIFVPRMSDIGVGPGARGSRLPRTSRDIFHCLPGLEQSGLVQKHQGPGFVNPASCEEMRQCLVIEWRAFRDIPDTDGVVFRGCHDTPPA